MTPFQNTSWIVDFLSPSERVEPRAFSESLTLPRLVSILIAGLVGLASGTGVYLLVISLAVPAVSILNLLALVFIPFVIDGVLMCLNGVVLASCYEEEPVVKEKRTFAARMTIAHEPLKRLEGALANNAKKEAALQDEQNQQRRRLNETLARLRDQEKRELDEVGTSLKKTIASIESRRGILDHEEQSSLRKLQGDIGSKLSSLNQQIASLPSAEANKIAAQLTANQDKYIENHLRSHRITEAPMAGQRYASRSSLEQALLAQGIFTASDISYARVDAVYGFGPKRTQALVSWRNQLEQQARFMMPRDLSLSDKNAIRSKYAAQRKSYESQRDVAQVTFSTEEKTIRDHCRVARQALDAELLTAQTQATQRVREISKRYAQEYSAPTNGLAQLATEYSAKYREIYEQGKQTRQEMFSVSRQIAKLNQEQAAFRKVSFSQYVRVVFLGHRAQ